MLAMLALLSLGALAPRAAAADPGDHIGTETSELIPAVELSAHHRTNVYLQEGTFGGDPQPETAGTYLQLHPSLAYKLEGVDTDFRLGANYTAKKYFQEELSNLDRYQDFDLSGNLNLLKESVVGLKVRDRFSSNGYESEADYAEDAYFRHLRNAGSGRISVRPGSSLEVDAGGDFSFDNFRNPVTESRSTTAGQNDRVGYGPGIEARWKFLPKTALVGEWGMEWYDWKENLVAPSGTGAANPSVEYGSYLGIPDGRIMRLTTGIRGRFTEKVIIGALVGYGTGISDEDTVIEDAADEPGSVTEINPQTEGFGADIKGWQGLLVELEGSYTPLESQELTLGYSKDFQDVYFTNFVAYNRLFTEYTGLFADRYELSAQVSYRLDSYEGEVERLDHRILSGLDFNYVATKYLDVGGGVDWRRRASADKDHPEIEYDDFDIHAGVTFTY